MADVDPGTHEHDRDLRGRSFLITGANTGIGRAAAMSIAHQGGHLVLACRSAERAAGVIEAIAATTPGSSELVEVDLADLPTVVRAVAELERRGTRIDVLVNNAGVIGQRGLSPQGFELTFACNHLGPFLLTELLLTRLGSRRPSRVVTVSSSAHRAASELDLDAVRSSTRTRTGLREYQVSKLCNVLFTQELTRRYARPDVLTCAVHPGVIASDIWRRVPWPLRPIATSFMRSVEEGAATVVRRAVCTPSEVVHGGYYDRERATDPSAVATPERAEELWRASHRWVEPYLTA